MDLTTVSPFFFAEDLASLDGTGILDPRESKHASGARRLRESDSIMLFDGAGTVARATITRLDPRGRTTSFAVDETFHVERSSSVLALVCAVPKGDRQSTILDMATQLGMTDYVPLISARSVTRPDGVNDRWKRTVLESCKQSRRPWLPVLHEPVMIEQLDTTAAFSSWHWVLAEADGESAQPIVDEVADGPVGVVVGPEGGLSEEEIALLDQRGARRLSLSDAVLRTETAAVAAVSSLSSARRHA